MPANETYSRPGIAGSGAIACGLAATSTATATTVLLARSEASAWRAEEDAVAACARIEGADPERLQVSTEIGDLAGCDLIVESVIEDLHVKSGLLAGLGGAAPEADLATTTSSLPVGEIGERSGQRDRLFGLHVFNPVPKMKLVELCFPQGTRDGIRERALGWCGALGKTAVEVPDQAGFVVNRLLFPYLFDAVRMMERTGMSAGEVDSCMTLGAGHPMGPLALLDFVGLDVAEAIGDALHGDSDESAHRPPGLLVEMVGEGRLGRKSGAGFYEYRLADGALAATADVPDHVGLGDPLAAGRLGDLRPGQLGFGKIVPAGQVERLQGPLQGRPEMLLGAQQRPQDLELLVTQANHPHRSTSNPFELRPGWTCKVVRSADGIRSRYRDEIRTASIRFSRTASTRIV